MKNVDSLVDEAAALAEGGLSKGEIADELNVSRETATWLVNRATADRGTDATDTPQDVHVDWSLVGQSGHRLEQLGTIVADVLTELGAAEAVVGVEKAGVPIATSVASELELGLCSYLPRKHRWEKGAIDQHDGAFSRNFASVEGANCYVVDDMITSGTTMAEAVQAVESAGGTVVGGAVIVDKNGIDDVDGVPVRSLISIVDLNVEGE